MFSILVVLLIGVAAISGVACAAVLYGCWLTLFHEEKLGDQVWVGWVRPRGRSVDSRPKSLAARCCQCGSPNGVPRPTARLST